MHTKRFSLLLLALFVIAISAAEAAAQGGWRQWDIYLVDGSRLLGTPLGMNEKGRFTHAMGDEEGIERSKISYLAIIARDLPPVPEGNFKQDLLVMRDGSRTFGTVRFVELKFSDGSILQNGKNISLENVAYIKFARPKTRRTSKRGA
jgi:hypothetical protein